MIEFSPEYGIVLDVLTSLVYQYNTDKESHIRQKMGLSTDGIKWIQSNFVKAEEELCIFFELSDNQRDSFMQYLFAASGDEIMPCTLVEFCGKYCTAEYIQKKITEYYLMIDYENNSLSTLRSYIAKSDYSMSIKFHLVSFYMDPELYVNMLLECLRTCHNKVLEAHKEKKLQIKQLIQHIDIDSIKEIDKVFQSNTEYSHVYLSVTSLVDNAIYRRGLGIHDSKETVIISIGEYWKEKIHQYMNEMDLDLVVFGKVLSEENRVRIIQYLLKNTEITISEAVQYLGTSVTATNYHLNMMADVKMLSVRNKGRKLFFSLNREYFEKAISVLRQVADQVMMIA